ncbi:apolipoprotein D-like [Argopecten irradians]|uniref:apolipoprotein D-like n=1 Tax=Argopecten irradians TaxID=31199 RepID=UPI0037197555
MDFVTYSILIQVLLIGVSQSFLVSTDGCMAPPPSSNFTNARYYGLWYEVGKIQTAGGGYFEKDCVCTTIGVTPKSGATNGDATAFNSCRKLSPTGEFLNATGALTGEVVPGHWKEGFFFLAPKADYTVIYLDDNYAIEYDCTSAFFMTNYCIHLLSRKPTADAAAVKMLLDFANSLQLNTQKLTYQATMQSGCWS